MRRDLEHLPLGDDDGDWGPESVEWTFGHCFLIGCLLAFVLFVGLMLFAKD